MRSHLLATGALIAVFVSASRADDAPKPPRVVVVGVDQKTLDKLGPWGGSYRARHALLIEQLNKAKVAGIAFDMYFPENPDQTAATAAIARAASTSAAPVVIAVNPDDAMNADVFKTAKVPEGNVRTQTALDVKTDADGTTVTALDKALPLDVLGRKPLSVELALRAKVLSPEDVDKLAETLTVGVTDGKPDTIKGFVPGSTDPKDVTTVSYVDVLEGKVDPSVLEGALVVVGMNDGKMDVTPNPKTGDDTSGVYFHAFALRRFVAFMSAKADAAAKAAAAKAAAAAQDPSKSRGLTGALR